MSVQVEKGVMVMLNGKAWGVEYKDAQVTQYGWIDSEFAVIHNPEFCKEPADITYPSDRNIDEINKGRLVKVERIVKVSIIIEE